MLGFASGCLATMNLEKVSGKTKRLPLMPNRYSTIGTRAAIAAAGRCAPCPIKRYQNSYILDPKTGLPVLSEENLNIMVANQEAAYIANPPDVGTFKTGNKIPIKPKSGGDVEIEYLYRLGGCARPFGIQRQDPNQSLTMVIEAPFIIHWDGWRGNRKRCPMGNVEIDLTDFGKERHLLQNVDINKLTNWIILHLTAIPDHKRVQKFVIGEMAWEARISTETVKTLQKD